MHMSCTLLMNYFRNKEIKAKDSDRRGMTSTISEGIFNQGGHLCFGWGKLIFQPLIIFTFNIASLIQQA